MRYHIASPELSRSYSSMHQIHSARSQESWQHTEAVHRLGFEALRPYTDQLESALSATSISFYPQVNIITSSDLRRAYPQGPLCVCDFHVEGIEGGAELAYGFEKDGILVIDHHAPVERFARPISSGNLAAIYRDLVGEPISPHVPVIINHLDVDSFVSALIMTGTLPPHPVLEQTVLDADHFCVDGNPFIDLLQSCQSTERLAFAARNVSHLIAGKELDPEALEMLRARAAERDRASQLVQSGLIRREGAVAWGELTVPLESDIVLSVMNEAAIILLFSPNPRDSERWIVRSRLGVSAPKGLKLFDLDLNQLDPNWGGRWNAGSNARAGGSTVAPKDYVEFVNKKFESWNRQEKQES